MKAEGQNSTASSLQISPPRLCKDEDGVLRPASAGYHPSVWGDYFILQQFPPSNIQEPELKIRERVEELVANVKVLLKNCGTQMQELQMINILQRLGVAYHFEEEIHEALSRVHEDNIDSDDLHFVSLRFRLLRQHGYYVPCSIFRKFQDKEGNFNSIFIKDTEALLSLYEATYLSVPGEHILEEAAIFSRKNLQSNSTQNKSKTLATLVSRALHLPLRMRIERLEARDYITIYEEDEDNRVTEVLELAKLDAHLLQLLYREEAKAITEWWNKIGLASKLTFARDRAIECYFWSICVYPEPQYSKSRLIFAKVLAQFSIMDDIYDAYGTVEELGIYTELIQRWNLDDIDQLNENMKFQYLVLQDLINDLDSELETDDKSYGIWYIKEIIKKTCSAWFKEAQWRAEGYVPRLDEYLSISIMTIFSSLLFSTSFVGMGEIATERVFNWVFNFPNIFKYGNRICRLLDDIASHELEQKRDHVASAVECYMKEHDMSLEEASKELLEMVQYSWKEVNQECMNEKEISMQLLTRVVNLCRVAEAAYKESDIFTHSSTASKDYITLLLAQPIKL